MIPFFAFAIGCTLDLRRVWEAGLLGLALGLAIVAVSGAALLVVDRICGGNGTAGLAAATTAANAAAVPALVAAAQPAYRDAAGPATILVAASVIVTSLATPVLTAWWARRRPVSAGAVARRGHAVLKDDALAAIREHLLGDDCTHPLSERSLAARLGIGLGSVRSALERLRAAGLVVATPNSGLRVPEVTSQEIIDFYEMRLVLECHIAAALAGRLTSEQSDQLDAILIEQEQTACARDTGRYHQLDLEFHAALVGFHRNAAMVRALDQLRDRMYQLSRRLHGAHPERLAVNAAPAPHHRERLAGWQSGRGPPAHANSSAVGPAIHDRSGRPARDPGGTE